MSKRNVNISATAALLILSTIFTIVGWHSGWVEFGDPVFTEVIPEKRPTRLDQKKLEAFSNKPINEILEFLLAEAATTVTEPPVIPPPAPAPALLGMLPDAPLPFPGSAAPRDEENLKKFITGMQQDKEGEPSKSEQWQFNLALAAIQVDPSKIPEAIRLNTHPVPESETFSVRLVPRDGEISGPFALGLFNREDGPGIVSGGGTNLSSLKAEGALDSLGSLSGTVPGNGIFPADFDADGDLDLFVTRGDGLPNSLLRNDGGKFEDVTISLGLLSFDDTTTAAWIDYDGDELLDLLVGSKDHPLELYHQTTGGVFQPIAWDLKLWVPRGVAFIKVADFSGDGSPDFFLGIDGLPDRLYLSRPSAAWNDWRFEDITADSAVDVGTKSTSAVFFDFDNDSLLDLLLTTAAPDLLLPAGPVDPAVTAPSTIRLFRNEGENRFADITDFAGLQFTEGVTAAGVADLDNDAYEDILLGTEALSINRVFWNREGLGFKDVSIVSQGSYLDEAVSFAFADLDRNGTTDVLYLNESGRVRWLEACGAMDAWLQVTVKGQPPGTRVSLTIRDKDWVLHPLERRLNTESSIMIGIGQADIIERLEVLGPDGGEPLATLEKIEPNREVVIELPKRPKKRAVVPMQADSRATTAP